jgi:hypothetical protein
MTEKEAQASTKYFGEGVYAEVWGYSELGNWWSININRRGATAWFPDLDTLKREIVPSQLRIGAREDNEVYFHSAEDFNNCVVELQNALDYVRSVSKERCWRELPSELTAIVDSE